MKRKKIPQPDGIIAWHPDRLARNMRDAGEIIELLDEGKIADLKFAMYSFHNDSSGKEHLAMEFARAKGYSDRLQDNVLRGTMEQEVKGRRTRNLPPAYKVINDVESEYHGKIIPSDLHSLWRDAYRWRLEGKTLEEIADRLLADGYESVKKRKKKQYTVQVTKEYVRSHLRNPLHCGWLVSDDDSKLPRRADLNEIYPIEYDEPFPVVVSLEDFKKINPDLFSDTANAAHKYRKRSTYPLAGKMICKERQEAGLLATMTAASPRSGSGALSPRFMCQRCKPQHSINLKNIFGAVEEKLKEIAMTEREHKLLVVTEWRLYEEEREGEERTRRQIAALKGSNQQDITKAREGLNTMKYEERASADEIAVQEAKVRRLTAEQEALVEREKKLNDDSTTRYEDLDAFLELAKNGSLWWNKANDEQKVKIADLLILNAIIDREGTATVSLAEPFASWSKRSKVSDGGRWLT